MPDKTLIQCKLGKSYGGVVSVDYPSDFTDKSPDHESQSCFFMSKNPAFYTMSEALLAKKKIAELYGQSQSIMCTGIVLVGIQHPLAKDMSEDRLRKEEEKLGIATDTLLPRWTRVVRVVESSMIKAITAA
ncbi:hypothetical protein V6O07_00535 [Arthrospira platensis SPKY2]